MQSSEKLKSLLSEIKKERQMVKNELRSYPAGDLMISTPDSGTQFFRVTHSQDGRIRKGIGSNQELIYKLARKAYLEKLLERLDSNEALLESYMKKYTETDPSDILKNLPKHFDLLRKDWIINPALMGGAANVPRPVSDGNLKPVRLAATIGEMLGKSVDTATVQDLISEWAGSEYCANTSYMEYKTHVAYNGLRARSKSEVAILACYGDKNIPYHYDELVLAENTPASPDFIAVRKDGSIFLHEHAGLWSENYLDRNDYKIKLYKRAGFVQGKNLLITFDDENGNINLKLISELIDDMYNR